jgi:diguanylate cyclase (GGDEF)-like protein/PAS domain S-box-containing protein
MKFTARYIGSAGLVAVIYGLLAHFSLALAIPPGNTSAIWPAAGFAVGVCFLYGYRYWPAILLGAAFATASTGTPWTIAFVVSLGNVAEALLVAWLIRRFTNISYRFQNSQDISRFLCFALLGTLTSACIGPGVLFLHGDLGQDHYLFNFFTWLLGDLAGIVIVTPAMITWKSYAAQKWTRGRETELALLIATFFFCSAVVFVLSAAPLLFLFLPIITWVALRFSQSEVCKVSLLLAAVSVAGTISRTGPTSMFDLSAALLLLQVFVCVAGTSALVLAVTVDERRATGDQLKRLQEQLEKLVVTRTLQLKQTVQVLEEDVEKRECVEKALRAKERQLEEAQRLAHIGSWEWDVAKDELIVSKEMMRIYGMPPEELAELTYGKYLAYIPPDERVLVEKVVRGALEEKRPISYEHHVIRPDGVVRYTYCQGDAEQDENGQSIRLFGTAQDVTEAKELETKLRETEELYRKLVEVSPDAIYLLDKGNFTYGNAAGLRLAGAALPNQLIGKRFDQLIDAEQRDMVINAVMNAFNETGSEEKAEIATGGKMVRLDGSKIDIELAAVPFRMRGKHDVLLVARDISERKKAEQKIQYLAYHDTLTDLGNRLLFKERLEHTISLAERTRKKLAILFIDLNRFKRINDTSGYFIGDQILKECAQRLVTCLRESDTVARSGGDEFLVLVESASHSLDIPYVARKILSALRLPFNAGGKSFVIDASIGISTFPSDGTDAETLLKHADTAMYRAKMQGQGKFCFYSESMTRQSLESFTLESGLQLALERKELELYFQPKVDLRTGFMSGAEALLRWNHPEHGLLLPGQFVPLAEETGLISEIGAWTIRRVCEYSCRWQEMGLGRIRIAVNLSLAQFHDHAFTDKLEALLHEFGLPPSILELELTESMLMENAEQLMGVLQKLKALGIHLSVDDFGTGYSSLAYLKRLPVDTVKVDRAFIKDLPTDIDDVAITHAVLALVHSLKRSVVAEGVETIDQLEFLVKNGCDEGQGYYFSPALPESEFRTFVKEARCFLV